MADLGRIGTAGTSDLQVGNGGVMEGKRILNNADYMKFIEGMTPADFASTHPGIVSLTDDVRGKIAAMDI